MIRYIFFDLGNVLLPFDHSIAIRNLATLASADEADIKRVVFDSGLQFDYEAGKVSSEEFCNSFCQELNVQVEQSQIMTAASDMFRLNVSIVPIVGQLRATCHRIGILSNTCEAHWNFVTNRFTIIGQYFSDRILSYEEKSMKPDADIYKAAIELAGVQPEEIFFTDDLEANVEGAKSVGIDAVQYTSSRELAEQLRRRDVAITL